MMVLKIYAGAGHVGQGLTCLDRWLVTQTQAEVKWDLITFNFGLHDLCSPNPIKPTLCSKAKQARCLGLYKEQLKNITGRLLATGAKLLYVTTTPFMPLRLHNDTVVESLNSEASAIMHQHSIPVVDLYEVVTKTCGEVYVNCSICLHQPCWYHYNASGYAKLSGALAAAIKSNL